jgi:hypothetical protein
MPILRHCIEELIRETPADLLSRFDFTVFPYHQSIVVLYMFSELWRSCLSVGLWYKNVQNYR